MLWILTVSDGALATNAVDYCRGTQDNFISVIKSGGPYEIRA